VLRPGEQATTAPGLGRVAVEDEIAWSANFEHHLALLREFARLIGFNLEEVLARIDEIPRLRPRA